MIPWRCLCIFSDFCTCGIAGDVDSRLTARLQAILAASHFLARQDSAAINAAAHRAIDTVAAAAAAGERKAGLAGGRAAEEWPGPNLAALALFALLHVAKRPRDGVPVAIDVLQEMVRIPSTGYSYTPERNILGRTTVGRPIVHCCRGGVCCPSLYPPPRRVGFSSCAL